MGHPVDIEGEGGGERRGGGGKREVEVNLLL